MDAAASALLQRAALLRRAEELLALALREAGGDKQVLAHVQNALRLHIEEMKVWTQFVDKPLEKHDAFNEWNAKIEELDDAAKAMGPDKAANAIATAPLVARDAGGGGGAAAARAPVPVKSKGTIVGEVHVLLRRGEWVKAKKTISRNRTVTGLVAAIVELIEQEQLEESIAGVSLFGRWLANLPTSWPASQGLKM